MEQKQYSIINLSEAENKGIILRGVNGQFWSFDYVQKGSMIPFLFEKLTNDDSAEEKAAYNVYVEAKNYMEKTGLYPRYEY